MLSLGIKQTNKSFNLHVKFSDILYRDLANPKSGAPDYNKLPCLEPAIK